VPNPFAIGQSPKFSSQTDLELSSRFRSVSVGLFLEDSWNVVAVSRSSWDPSLLMPEPERKREESSKSVRDENPESRKSYILQTYHHIVMIQINVRDRDSHENVKAFIVKTV